MSVEAKLVLLGIVLEQCLAPVPGGTGRYSRELAGALARTAPAGCSVASWTAWHRSAEMTRVAGVAGPHRLLLTRRALIVAWERGLRPFVPAEVVHAPTLLHPPPRQGRRLVVTVHDAVPWTHPETLTPRGVAWHRRMAARAARYADLLVVPTSAVAAELASVLPGLSSDRLRVVGEGVTAGLVQPPADADERAERLRLPVEGFLFTLATLEPRKGLDVALAALAHPAAPDLPLLVAGRPGWGGVDLTDTAARLGLGDRVRRLGEVGDLDLAVLLARATALVLPSRSEGFGLPLLEAMAAGLPAVTSDAPALVEVAGGASRTVPVGDAAALASTLTEVVGDAELRAVMSAAGRVRATAYSWDGAARQLWAAYRELE